jgi:long-chain acyl-CoA synthetase
LVSNSKSIISSLGYDNRERILAVLPFPFVAGNTSQLIVSFVLGATLYIHSGYLYPKKLFETIEKYEITSTTIVASVLSTLLEDGTDYSEQAKSLRVICFGGGPTNPKTFEKLKRNPLCDKFVHMYGQTEASPRVSHLFINREMKKIPSVGKPLPGINVKSEAKTPKENPSEILVKGKNVMVGYYKSNSSPIEDGWLHTGDLGYVDEDGFIFITGRKRNIIIYSGMNIFPEEVESILLQNQNVKEALVYKKSDEQFGEIPIAKVVLKDKALISEKDLMEYCHQYLSYYKVPKSIEFVGSLEHTMSGKIRRKA